MIRKVKARIAPEQKVRDYFSRTRADFDILILHHVIVAEEGQALLLLSEIQDEGEEFTEIAKRHSKDTISAQMGGYFGPIKRKVLEGICQSKLADTQPGDLIEKQ